MSTAEVKGVSQHPGGLRSQASMVIQTRQAQRLVDGREKNGPAIIGMTAFGRRTRNLWLSAQNDDPYADWFLIRIEDAIETARGFIQEKTKAMQQLLKVMEGVKIEVAVSMDPVAIPLQFTNPYGYMGAYLIADFDELVRWVLTARHFGLIDRDKSMEILNGASRPIRRAFHCVAEWHFTSINRDDVIRQTAAAKHAEEIMGAVPQNVLDGTHRARYAPDIRKRKVLDPFTDSLEKLAIAKSRAPRSVFAVTPEQREVASAAVANEPVPDE